MILHERFGTAKKRAWEKFGKYHYSPNTFSVAARVFLATEVFDGKEVCIGMAACTTLPSGTVKNAWVSHKVVILPSGSKTGVVNSPEQLSLPDFDRNHLWQVLADALAARLVGEGHRYFCNASSAPPELISYRNDPASGWRPTSKNGLPPRDKGHGKKYGNKSRAVNAEGLVVSHEYVGAPKPSL